MGVTDMRHAILYALTYPERHPSDLPALNLAKLASLHFEPPDLERFPCISLAYRALRTGGTMPAAHERRQRGSSARFYCGTNPTHRHSAVIEAVMNQHSCVRPFPGERPRAPIAIRGCDEKRSSTSISRSVC
jgi:1-deoxy-D-xylulose-5-phosphate reductoisomerase